MNEHAKHRMKAQTTKTKSSFVRTIKSFLFIFLLSAHVFASAVAAQTVNVKISITKPTVGKIIDILNDQTGYEFSYDAGLLSEKLSDISVDMKNKNIEEVLSSIFGNANISYKVINNRVFLKKEKVESTVKTESTNSVQQQVKQSLEQLWTKMVKLLLGLPSLCRVMLVVVQLQTLTATLLYQMSLIML